MNTPLKAPFPWYGGKSRAAPLIWQALGDVTNYVEAFAGSLATLLKRPHLPKTETVNDRDAFLCIGPETHILQADLRWKHAADVQVGDAVLGFDEMNGPAQSIPRRADRPQFQPPTRMRRWRIATVTACKTIRKPAYRLSFDDGTTVVASADHLWLAGKSVTGGRGARWIPTARMRADASIYRTHVVKLTDVTDPENTAAAGWLGGFYDGEGNIRGTGAGWRINVSQKLGPEADRVEQLLRARDFKILRNIVVRDNPNHHPIARIEFNGGMRETLRFLMLTRPERLIRNALERIHTRSIYARERQVVGLIQKEYLGEQEVVAIETDCHTYVANGLASHNCNVWRALQAAPDEVAQYCDRPVNEADQHAVHTWLVSQREAFTARLMGDPDYYDAQVAGRWLYGIACWIGGGWCNGNGPWQSLDGQLVHLGDAGRGVHRQLVHLGNAGRGVHRQLVHLGNAGQGVHRQLVHLGNAGQGVEGLYAWFQALQDRLRYVRVCCGDWTRVLGPSVTWKHGLTGILLDPPYSAEEDRTDGLYALDDLAVAHQVRDWCKANGANPFLRLVLCGYGDVHDTLLDHGWTKTTWTANGGFSNQRHAQDAVNKYRETLWCSPACLTTEPHKQLPLF